MARLEGKVCVITGAGGGMGADAAQLFSEEGAQICVADDPGAGAHLTVEPARRHRGDAVHELDLADGLERFGPADAVHRAALEVDGRTDIVTALQIREQLVEEIPRHLPDDLHEWVIGRRHILQNLGRPIPEMMMRIDDRQIGLEDRFHRVGHARRRTHASPGSSTRGASADRAQRWSDSQSRMNVATPSGSSSCAKCFAPVTMRCVPRGNIAANFSGNP